MLDQDPFEYLILDEEKLVAHTDTHPLFNKCPFREYLEKSPALRQKLGSNIPGMGADFGG